MKERGKTISRRELGIAAAALTPALLSAQQAPESNLAAAAREDLKRATGVLRNFRVPLATEPSFVFRP